MTDLPIRDLLAEASETVVQDIASTAQMNFMFGVSLVTAKLLIRTVPEAAESYDRLLGNVTEALKRRGEVEFAGLLEHAAEAGGDTLEAVSATVADHQAALNAHIAEIEQQYRQELFEAQPEVSPDADD